MGFGGKSDTYTGITLFFLVLSLFLENQSDKLMPPKAALGLTYSFFTS